MDPIYMYMSLIVIGLVLIGAEIFLPGGILGMLGGLALTGAIVSGFFAFGLQGGFLSMVAILVFGAVVIIIWMRIFPNTPLGKRFTLSQNGHDIKIKDQSHDLLGKHGHALCDLRPSGVAMIDGKRIDVIADGSFIAEGFGISVIEVSGNRVKVQALDTEDTH